MTIGIYGSSPNPSISEIALNKIPETNIYAKKGDEIYEVEMDTNDDGIVTCDEFKKYCKDNDISDADIENLVKKWSNFKLTKSQMLYAQEGDYNYDETMDTNGDAKISYNEYLKYINEKNAKFPPKEEEESYIDIYA